MLRTGVGLCFLIACWAVAGADKCDINANGTSTCAGFVKIADGNASQTRNGPKSENDMKITQAEI